eukprot:6203781-Pleurochrysis_carterae.AAC.3
MASTSGDVPGDGVCARGLEARYLRLGKVEAKDTRAHPLQRVENEDRALLGARADGVAVIDGVLHAHARLVVVETCVARQFARQLRTRHADAVAREQLRRRVAIQV